MVSVHTDKKSWASPRSGVHWSQWDTFRMATRIYKYILPLSLVPSSREFSSRREILRCPLNSHEIGNYSNNSGQQYVKCPSRSQTGREGHQSGAQDESN